MNKKRILITAARAPITLDLARQLHRQGHEVLVGETSTNHVCRYSNTVEKSIIIPSPRFDSEGFIQALLDAVEREKIDTIIPTYEESIFLAKGLDRFPKTCKVFCGAYDTVTTLHNKWEFENKLNELNIPTPKTHLIRSKEDLDALDLEPPFVLKTCYSRASLNLFFVEKGDPIPELIYEEHNPWIAQEWIKGNRICTYSICHDGEVKAHGAYPVEFTIEGNSCLNFKTIDHPKSFEWIKHFIKEVNYTGQIAFDFIEQEDGKIFAIECNPRATSGIHLFREEDRIDRAFFNETEETIFATPGSQKQIFVAMLFWGYRSPHFANSWSNYFKQLLTVKDVVFDLRDPFPLIMEPFLFLGYIKQARKMGKSLVSSVLYDIEWNGEVT